MVFKGALADAEVDVADDLLSKRRFNLRRISSLEICPISRRLSPIVARKLAEIAGPTEILAQVTQLDFAEPPTPINRLGLS